VCYQKQRLGFYLGRLTINSLSAPKIINCLSVSIRTIRQLRRTGVSSSLLWGVNLIF